MDFTKLESKKFPGKARTQFLAHRASIEVAIQRGFPLTVIWQTLQEDGLFDAKYLQFVRYVNSLIHGKKQKPIPSGKPEIRPSAAPNQAQGKTEESSDGSYMLGGIRMDPNRPVRPNVEMPKEFKWNPKALTDEEIRTGKITSR